MYAGGKSHQTIAPFIKQIGDRKKLFIASKVHMAPHAATPDKFRSNFDKSLADLETDYLDLFYMHMAHDKAYLTPEILKMAEGLKKEGKIRFFGFTAHDAVPEMLQAGAALGGGIDAIMFRYNFRQYGDKELNMAMDACKKAGIGLIAMKTLGSIPDDAEEALKFKSDEFTLTQAKLKAVWADERIDAVCSQMSSVEHVMENTAAAMSPVKLSMNDFVQLNRFAARTSPQYCTGCSHLCESKVDCNLRIADTLRYLMYHDAYGEKESARQLYSALADCEETFPVLIWRPLPPLARKASISQIVFCRRNAPFPHKGQCPASQRPCIALKKQRSRFRCYTEAASQKITWTSRRGHQAKSAYPILHRYPHRIILQTHPEPAPEDVFPCPPFFSENSNESQKLAPLRSATDSVLGIRHWLGAYGS